MCLRFFTKLWVDGYHENWAFLLASLRQRNIRTVCKYTILFSVGEPTGAGHPKPKGLYTFRHDLVRIRHDII